MTEEKLPQIVQEALQNIIDLYSGWLGNPVKSICTCFIVSEDFCGFIKAKGGMAEVTGTYWHKWVRVYDEYGQSFYIDLTARQFDEGAPFPDIFDYAGHLTRMEKHKVYVPVVDEKMHKKLRRMIKREKISDYGY